MVWSSLFGILFLAFTLFLLVLVSFKRFVKKQTTTTYYTPFDKITGQTPIEFHEEKEVRKQEDVNGEGDE